MLFNDLARFTEVKRAEKLGLVLCKLKLLRVSNLLLFRDSDESKQNNTNHGGGI